MVGWICRIVMLLALAYGGFVDYRQREIPNLVPVVLLLAGCVCGSVLWRLAAMGITLLVLILSAKLCHEELPGGDLKLICAMVFAAGPVDTLLTLFLAGLGTILVGLIKKKPLLRHVPLCTYVAPAFLLLSAAQFLIGGI